ncbi:EAL and HDOD domain-containing protein [Propionivibrio limicola]|uniref:EAL and HDOD domain-containing protein n=1 Tax=Propionivibrio limicola TaxID=167645 RepID=UPI001479735C|nr:HDOD domain-containing protein [Propionivibrio limicola]
MRLSGTPTASRTLSLRLLHLVATDADTHEIEAIFREDPVLAYHLLRLVNSLGVGVGRHISSFSQAIIILGRQQLKRWLNLMLFAANMNDYRAGMLMARVTVRARSMELLAALLGRDRTVQEAAFMCGMFSLLGVLFGMPLASVLAPLKLNESIAAGVLRHDGTLGQLLKIVEGVEQGRSDAIRPLLETANIGDRDLNEITLAAHEWMLNVIRDKQSDYDG